MSYNDFLRTFTHIEAVHLDADTARDEPSLIGKMPWVLRLYHGRWQKGVTAGGCRNNTGKSHMIFYFFLELENFNMSYHDYSYLGIIIQLIIPNFQKPFT